jgi:hypothetical protein
MVISVLIAYGCKSHKKNKPITHRRKTNEKKNQKPKKYKFKGLQNKFFICLFYKNLSLKGWRSGSW